MVSKRILLASSVIQSVHEGLNREQLMEKHGLSAEGLKAVLKHIRAERDRRACQIIQDFQSGMDVKDIAARNGFPAERFLEILRKVVSLQFQQPTERTEEAGSAAFEELNSERRRFPRIRCPVLTAPLREASSRESVGTILDLSENGVAVRGIVARIDDEKTFLISESDYDLPDPIVITCKCRWSEMVEASAFRQSAGFEITGISEQDERHLRALIQAEERLTCPQGWAGT